MLKVQTGQIVEFYSNSCCVMSEGKEHKCKIQGRINLVVGDLVEIELSSVGSSSEGLVIRRLERVTALYKSKEKVKKPMAEELIFGALSKGGHVDITIEKEEISLKYSSNQDKKKELV